MVVVGGGTGTHTVLTGLSQYAKDIDITAIVSMADSGGSTGRLRDSLGMLPVGDVRLALAALANKESEQDILLRKLFLHRFVEGDGIAGHNVGNLLLTALTEITASEDEIDDPPEDRREQRITELNTYPCAHITPRAREALSAADMIILGPGDLYSSVLAACVVGGMREAISAAKATVGMVGNIMERPGQTVGMTARETMSEITRYAGRTPDYVFLNTAPLPAAAREYYYTRDGTVPVQDDLPDASLVVRGDLLLRERVTQQAGDAVPRSLLRHDPHRLARSIVALL